MDELTSSSEFESSNKSAFIQGTDLKRIEKSFEKIDSMSCSQEFIPTHANKNSPDKKNKDLMLQSILPSTKEPEHSRNETYIEKLKNIGTNLKYNLGTLGQTLIWRNDTSEETFILGEEIEENSDDWSDDSASKKLILQKRISSIIWFSYRKNFPALISKKVDSQKDSYINDTGWGCMIRACQMAFAQCLSESIYKGNIVNKVRNNRRELDLITKFLDTVTNAQEAPYSIQHLADVLYTRFKLKPGIWFKPSSVLLALQDIHNAYKPLSTEEKTNLDLEIFLEGTIYLKPILNRMVTQIPEDPSKYCEGFEVIEDIEDDEEKADTEKKIIKEREEKAPIKDYVQEIGISDFFEEKDANERIEINKLLGGTWQHYLMITVLAKIGLDKPNPDYLTCLKKLLKLPQSRGMIGGKPGLAYYIIGFCDDKLIYLDPHFVQEAVQKAELKEKIGTYFCKELRMVNFSDIDTSIGLCFLIKNDGNDFVNFLTEFNKIARENDSFLGLELNPLNFDNLEIDDFESDKLSDM